MMAEDAIRLDTMAITDHVVDVLPGTSQNCKNHDDGNEGADVMALHSVDSFVCRICHSNEHAERLISPCLCKGSLTYVHSYCLETWIGTSRCTTCELCHFQYNTEQTLRYSLYQSLRIWYGRHMSRRALQEDCQMFLLLTLIAFGIVGTLLVAVQFYILRGHINGLGRIWTKGWLIFFQLITLAVYLINAYLIIRAQLLPWYRWWQSARDIRLILENHKPPYAPANNVKREEVAKSCVETTADLNCAQQNVEAVLHNDEAEQRTQSLDGKVETLTTLDIFSDHSNTKMTW